MTPKERKTAGVSRGRYTVYAKRARGCMAAMENALNLRHWDTAGLNAVHCAISATDALTVFFAGVRSAGEAHQDAVILLEQHVKDEQAGSKAKTLAKILAHKNAVAYLEGELTEAGAQELAKITRRFLEWAFSILP